ncbi:hypothetical protein OPV22_027425 [Ensete ventricosum]|uniref:4Fe-4S ferredoxin-type domain-containing protein n=1 Tax=Ensete ventricosum TaxID=4639 RepID=A0AAV8PVA8_ENSVE|nr:hypothetical protein OPV22_027425 [Ensete ventricosum]
MQKRDEKKCVRVCGRACVHTCITQSIRGGNNDSMSWLYDLPKTIFSALLDLSMTTKKNPLAYADFPHLLGGNKSREDELYLCPNIRC